MRLYLSSFDLGNKPEHLLALAGSARRAALEGVSDPTVVPAGYKSDIIWEGLGLLPFSIAVHVDSDHPELMASGFR